MNMKNLSILLCVFILLSCVKKNDDKNYLSKGLYNYKLSVVDSLTFNYSDSLFIGEIYSFLSWNDDILVVDKINRSVWVFNKKLKFKKIIGRKGRGPSEFVGIPFPFISNDKRKLFIADYSQLKVAEFDEGLKLVSEHQLDKGIAFNSVSPVSIDKYFIFPSMPIDNAGTAEYFNSNSLSVLDKNFKFVKTILKWDPYYKELSYYAVNNIQSLVVRGEENSFFAMNLATYRINKINENLIIEKVFGIKPLFYKNPPKDVYTDYNNMTIEKQMEFGSKVTWIDRAAYDELNNIFFINYTNITKEAGLNGDYIEKTDNYLQGYNSNLDCIIDEKIPGKLAFVREGKIYVLTSENKDYFKIKGFHIVAKDQNE